LFIVYILSQLLALKWNITHSDLYLAARCHNVYNSHTHTGKQVWLERSLVGKYPSILFERT